MASSQHADASLLRLFHFLLALLIMVLLMWGVATQFEPRRQDALRLILQQRMADFAERAELLHGEWLSQGRPKQIFHDLAGVSGRFEMSEAGWPRDWLPHSGALTQEPTTRCMRLWRGLLGKEGELTPPVHSGESTRGLCLFHQGELSYRYDDSHGFVSFNDKQGGNNPWSGQS